VQGLSSSAAATYNVSAPAATAAASARAKCELIYAALCLLLLRQHLYSKARRLGSATGLGRVTASNAATGVTSAAAAALPLVLQPILDVLQYELFCTKVIREIRHVATALDAAGVTCKLRFLPVGDGGEHMISLLGTADPTHAQIGGEVVLRIDGRSVRSRFWRLSAFSPISDFTPG
jgi:mediator of RNA polymerase II transcription subunit 17, fungi type